MILHFHFVRHIVPAAIFCALILGTGARALSAVADTGPREERSLEAFITEGDLHFHAGDYAAAAREFAAAVARYPDAPIPRLAWGHALFAAGRFESAADAVLSGMEILPDWARAAIDIRGFFASPSDFADRMAELGYAVTDQPADASLLFLYAYCNHFSGQKGFARVLFARLAALVPDHAAAALFLALPAEETGSGI